MWSRRKHIKEINCLNKWMVIHTTHYTQRSTEHRHVAEIERCLKQTIHPAEGEINQSINQSSGTWQFMPLVWSSPHGSIKVNLQSLAVSGDKVKLTLFWRNSSKRSTCKHKLPWKRQKESLSTACKRRIKFSQFSIHYLFPVLLQDKQTFVPICLLSCKECKGANTDK